MAQPIPQALSHLVALNAKFNVLICIDAKCRYALQPSAVVRHLRDRHKTPRALQKQVEQYVNTFPFTYDHTSVPLPADGSAPQPIVPAVDGFACRDCAFKTQGRATIRQHSNQAHNKKRAADEDISKAVRLQSWFGEKRERYT
jgi:Orsellinic acid/F9775 biosynthesis cluster protein D